jgi:hypothetical protein
VSESSAHLEGSPSLSLYKDGEPPGLSNDLTDPPQPRQTVSSTKTQRQAVNNAILFGAVIVLGLIGTQLKGSVTKTMERFGRSLALEGQLSAQWSKAKTH